MLAVTLLAGLALPFASASGPGVTIEFLNPLGKIDMHDNIPLAERKPWNLGPDGKLRERIVLAMPTNGTQMSQIAIAMHLIDQYGKYDPATGHGIILVTSSIGGNWGPNADVSYDLLGNSPDGLPNGTAGNMGWPPTNVLGGASANINTYYTIPAFTFNAPVAGTLPEGAADIRNQNDWNLLYSSHPNMSATGVVTGTANWVGDIDVALAGTAI